MAIPVDHFNYRYGTVLMRYHHATGEWFFVGWVSANDTFIENLGPGEYTYALWVVMGFNAGSDLSHIVVDGFSRLAVVGAKK